MRLPKVFSSPGSLRGMLLIGISALGFSAMHAMIRFLAGDMHPFEIAFFRNLFGLVVLVPVILRQGRRPFRTQRFGTHLARSLLQLVSMLLFFSAIARSPLAEISAMSFTAPLFATVGAILFLGERLRTPRIVALVLGFAGTLIVTQPGSSMSTGTILALTSAVVWSVALLVIKSLSRTDSTVTLALYMGLMMAPLSFFPALPVWTWPSGNDYLWLLIMGMTGTISHLAMGLGFQDADASLVMPVDFTRLIWASGLGFIFFGEIPGAATWIGGTLIFGSTTFIGIREARAARQASSPFTEDLGPPESVLRDLGEEAEGR